MDITNEDPVIKDPEKPEGFSHSEINSAFKPLVPGDNAQRSADEYGDIASKWSDAVTVFAARIRRSSAAAWDGPAAEKSREAIGNYAQRAEDFTDVLDALAVRVDNAVTAILRTQRNLPEVLEKKSGWNPRSWPVVGSHNEDKRNDAESSARQVMSDHYVTPFVEADRQIPKLPVPVSPTTPLHGPIPEPEDGKGGGDGGGGGNGGGNGGGGGTGGGGTGEGGTGETGGETEGEQPGEETTGGESTTTDETDTSTTPSSTEPAAATTQSGTTPSTVPSSTVPTGTGYGGSGGGSGTGGGYGGTPGMGGTGGGSGGSGSGTPLPGRSLTGGPGMTGGPMAASTGAGGGTGAAGRAGMPGMMSPGAAGRGQQGQDEEEHKLPDYLINAENSAELLGEQPRTVPGGVIGGDVPAAQPPQQT
ncbi:hypothetical protein [Nocardia cyriacigeorgica]|uniref:hypothetical protein n=1 Tax=Nocardia cyriacigeorgica TaxID=135487 RepID=UPI0018932029|nr:hypothetical protein [Nocardia cyriacigeorgica]MBF6437876.1 hypothetical protein [Nocardia cyriacigeorgica]